jgi:hypothetical protein
VVSVTIRLKTDGPDLHFIGLVMLFVHVITHITLVFLVYFHTNDGNMVFGSAVGLFHVVATLLTMRHQRSFQEYGGTVLEPVLLNGYPPDDETYCKLAEVGGRGGTTTRAIV